MKRIASLTLLLVGLFFYPAVNNSASAQGPGLCCFNTSIPDMVCFYYMVYEPDGSSYLESVPGIRLGCTVE
ncbi:hypothetical protein JYB64_02110 [Algoriphagus aestuarii]|nr:hypothetical protein [Algoriphagus aestuarii]